eukprot:1161133-Pelagomonas_calceolata.AAC.9
MMMHCNEGGKCHCIAMRARDVTVAQHKCCSTVLNAKRGLPLLACPEKGSEEVLVGGNEVALINCECGQLCFCCEV